MNERSGIWRSIRWRLLLLVGVAAILGLIDLLSHLVFGVDVLKLSSRESPLPTSQALPLFLLVLALVAAIGAGGWGIWRWLQRRNRPAPRRWQPPR